MITHSFTNEIYQFNTETTKNWKSCKTEMVICDFQFTNTWSNKKKCQPIVPMSQAFSKKDKLLNCWIYIYILLQYIAIWPQW